MNFTRKLHVSPAARTSKPRAVGRLLLLSTAAALLAAVVAAPAVAPYHGRLRAVFVTLLPLCAGYMVGALDHSFARRHVPALLGGAALVLLAAVLPGLRADAPRLTLALGLAGGVAVAMALVRIGLLQAGIGWRNHTGNLPEDYAPRWAAALAFVLAWSWLLIAVLNPREGFPPTRWLLTITGAPPSALSRQVSRVTLLRAELTSRRIAPERGLVTKNGYDFRVGPLTPGPGSLQAAVSVQRADGRPFGGPVWLTMDADDPRHPDAGNDAQFFDVNTLADGDAPAVAARAAAASPIVTTYAWYGLTQSLPSVRLRARLWMSDGETGGRMVFRPVAEADLGTWRLTILRKLRPTAP